MEQQSGNNFDALFQKAAEDYPLKTDNSNWDIVAAKLRTNTIPPTAVKSRRWQYAVVLLLFTSAGSIFYFYNNSVSVADRSAGNRSKIASGNISKQLNGDKKANIVITSKKFQSESNNNLANSNLTKQFADSLPAKSIFGSSNTMSFEQQNYLPDNKIKTEKIIDFKNLGLAQNSFNQNKEFQNNSAVDNKSNTPLTNKSVDNNETTNNKSDNFKSVESHHVKLAPQPKLLYGELFIAPDFSTVKLQNVNAPGYNVGVAIGYKISKRFSIELGLERLHTDFYSNAKYLDKSHLRLKPNTTVQFVDGKSKLTEVPFDIKYNLSKKNDHFYVTMGANIARITHTEKYNYEVIKDGTRHAASKHFGALTGTEFFSDLNFSAGYQTKLSGSFSLKAEPYYQVPLKGLGVGNLPVTNFGVSIGIIKDLR